MSPVAARRIRWAFAVCGVLAACLGGAYVAASRAAAAELERIFEPHRVEIPVPFPLADAELAELRTRGEDGAADPAAIALARAIDRGQHLVESRYICIECHGADFGGGVMVDDPAMGSLLGPNLTAGKGSVTAEYTMTDWDRIVRHGVRRDGRPAVMPSEDFLGMSDRELSDIVAYIRSVPAVDREVPRSSLGPVGKIMLATGRWRLGVDMIENHDRPHPVEPPGSGVTVEFGSHLARVCAGCHRESFEGGAIAQGPPSWPPATNLTQYEQGLLGWSFEQFEAVMREGRKPDGSEVREPMTLIVPYARRMTDTELRALWLYLTSLPPVQGGG